uniref:Uncharacterized protein n=1 Tax=Oncorhynchus tshawytscha TaxID=74940 RepID=A0A8C8JG19_ONCTS
MHNIFITFVMCTDIFSMTDVEPVVTDFAATGRTGRRNAVPDITGAGPADLSDKLAELCTHTVAHMHKHTDRQTDKQTNTHR